MKPDEHDVVCRKCGALLAKEFGKLMEIKIQKEEVLISAVGTIRFKCRRCLEHTYVPLDCPCPLSGCGQIDASMKC